MKFFINYDSYHRIIYLMSNNDCGYRAYFVIYVPSLCAYYQTRCLVRYIIGELPNNTYYYNWLLMLFKNGPSINLQSLYYDTGMVSYNYLKINEQYDTAVLRLASKWDLAWWVKYQALRNNSLSSAYLLFVLYTGWLAFLFFIHSNLGIFDLVYFVSLILCFVLVWSKLPRYIVNKILQSSHNTMDDITVIWLMKHQPSYNALYKLGSVGERYHNLLLDGASFHKIFDGHIARIGCKPSKMLSAMRRVWFSCLKHVLVSANYMISLLIITLMVQHLFKIQQSIWTIEGLVV